MNDLRTPTDMRRQRAIEAITESDRTKQERRELTMLRNAATYRPTALGDR